MNLVDAFGEEFIWMVKEKVSDGASGYLVQWHEGETFIASVTMDTSLEARIAEKQGVTSVHTVTVKREVPLEYDDVIKRKADGQMFRITSVPAEKQSPKKVGTLNMKQATAEKWELTQ